MVMCSDEECADIFRPMLSLYYTQRGAMKFLLFREVI